MDQPNLLQLTEALRRSWNEETGYAGAGQWSRENPARGQCVTSALVVQDYFGGDIKRYWVTGDGIAEAHYANLLEDGTALDTTGSQYTAPVTMTAKPAELKGYATLREKRLADDETYARYLLLKARVEQALEPPGAQRGQTVDVRAG